MFISHHWLNRPHSCCSTFRLHKWHKKKNVSTISSVSLNYRPSALVFVHIRLISPNLLIRHQTSLVISLSFLNVFIYNKYNLKKNCSSVCYSRNYQYSNSFFVGMKIITSSVSKHICVGKINCLIHISFHLQ